MRIFFIHQFYRTPEEGGGIRSWYVTRALQKAGHEVILVTGAASGDNEVGSVKYEERLSSLKLRQLKRRKTEDEDEGRETRFEDGRRSSEFEDGGLSSLKLRQLKREETKGYEVERPKGAVEVIRLPVSWSNSMSFWQRIKAFVKFLYLARKEAKKHEFDLVYAISVPLSSGWLALRIKKPFVFEVGDLWPDVPIEMGILRNLMLKFYSRKLEKKIYKKADLIISLSKDIQFRIYQKWFYTANIVVENFSDLSLFKTEYQANYLSSTDSVADSKQQFQNTNYELPHRKQGEIICTYVGTAGIANDLIQMVELAKVAEKQFPQIQFYLMIAGKEEEKIKNSAPGNVRFVNYGNKEKVAELLAKSDFNFVCYAQYPLLGTGSPNKFFDGLAAGCITVINVKGWIEELILKEKAGVFWDVKDPRALLNSIQSISVDPDMKNTYKSNALNLAERFDKDKLVDQIVQQINLRFE